MDKLDLIDIYRTLHSKKMNFTFSPSAHRNFSRTDHILGHKSSLDKFKKIEIIPSIFSDHNVVRLDVNYRKKKKQHTSEWSTNHRINKKINQNMQRNKWKWKHNNPKPMGFSKSSAKGKDQSNTSLPQETR